MSARTKLAIYLGGSALFLLSLAYVAMSVARNLPAVEATRLQSVPWLVASVALYAISHVSTGLSWPLAVKQIGIGISILDGLRIGFVAQIGKYLPGNVAHYAGRGVLAKRLGIPLRATGVSTAIEIGSAITAAIIVSGLGLLADHRPVAQLPTFSTSAVAIVIGLVAALSVTWFWLFRRGANPALLAGPAFCLAVSFCLSSLSIYSLAQSLGYELPLAVSIGAFTLAWAAGFLIPGAPAGLGVREATWLAMLGPIIGPGPAAVVAIIHRMITAAVDSLVALGGYAWLASGSFAKK